MSQSLIKGVFNIKGLQMPDVQIRSRTVDTDNPPWRAVLIPLLIVVLE